MDSLRLEQAPERPEAILVLQPANRDPTTLMDQPEPGDVLDRDRLLEPVDAAVGHGPCERDGARSVIRRDRIDHEQRLRPHRCTQLRHPIDIDGSGAPPTLIFTAR